MMLPHPDDVLQLCDERNIPSEIAKELIRLARARATRSLRVVPNGDQAFSLAEARNLEVREQALWALYRDPSTAIPWPWESLDRLYGSLMPGDVHIVVARTNTGKTTFILNLVMQLAERHYPIRVLPFETPPQKLLRTLAAIRLGYDPRHVLRDKWDLLPAEAFDAIQTDIVHKLTAQPLCYDLTWAPQGTMTPENVYIELEQAADAGARVVIIDHLNRIELPGRQPEHVEARRLMRGLKDRAEKLELHLVIPAQAHRGEGRDPLRRHMPPIDTDIRWGGSVEEEADGILGLYMPLKEDISPDELKRARAQLVPVKSLVRPNTTGIRVIKHRIDGGVVGEDVFLTYNHGRLSEGPLRDFGRYDV
jgi:replicative DNA helicase